MHHHQHEYHYTVRSIEGGRYECLVEELGERVTADTLQAALQAGEALVAAALLRASYAAQARASNDALEPTTRRNAH